MGYILLSPKYIKSKSKENKIENWHLFKAKRYKEKLNLSQQLEEIRYLKEEYTVEIIDDGCFPEFKEEVEIIKYIQVSSEYYKSISIEYDLKKETTKYKGLKYFTDEKQTLFYSDNEDTIRVLACILGRKVCGRCMATLYGDK